MRVNRRGAFTLFAGLVLASCASDYQSSSLTGGYEENKLSPTDWSVAYYGNGYTSDESVQTYWLYRCAEITMREGYDGFQIVSDVRLTQAETPMLRPVVERPMTFGHPYMVATIRMLRAPLPEAPGRVFEARRLQQFLQPYVTGPRCGSNVCPHAHRYLFPNYGELPPA